MEEGVELRVLNVLPDNHIGGPQIRVINVGEKLRDEGIETILAFPKGDGPLSSFASGRGFISHPITLMNPKKFSGISSIGHNVLWPFSLLPTISIISNLIDDESIDIVHANGFFSFQAPLAGFIKKKKVVWHLMGTMYPDLLIKVARRTMMKISSTIVVISESIGSYYLADNLNSVKVRIVHEGVDTSKFSRELSRTENMHQMRRRISINDTDKIIVSVGNVSPVKGYETLIDCARELKNNNRHLKIVIAGDIPKQQEDHYRLLSRKIHEYGLDETVLFLGRIEEIRELLNISDVFVLSSITEGTPIAILEAMAMEIPVVATEVGGIPDIIRNGENGLLVPANDPKSLADAIMKLIDDPIMMASIGLKGRETVEKEFSLDSCVMAHIEIYNNK